MDVTRSFLIRIYRQEHDALIGLVEAVETGETSPFRSLAELCERLTRPSAMRRQTLPNGNDKAHGS